MKSKIKTMFDVLDTYKHTKIKLNLATLEVALEQGTEPQPLQWSCSKAIQGQFVLGSGNADA